MADDDRSIEIESLKQMSKEYYQKNVQLKKEVKALQEQIISIFDKYQTVTSQEVAKTKNLRKMTDELISSAKKELLIVSPILDQEYFGKLIDKSKSVQVTICTLDKQDIKDKEFHNVLKALKSDTVIKSVTNSSTNSLVIISDKEKALFSSGSLTKKSFSELFNIGFLLTYRNDINNCIRFANSHFPSFMQSELLKEE
ncbi:MAG: TrmB family transcriptional regulator sugar-binding domain-containing protein [Candidatus Helarchaeota archaeon]